MKSSCKNQKIEDKLEISPTMRFAVSVLAIFVVLTALADISPMPTEMMDKSLLKSMRNPIFAAFWFLWSGLIFVVMALFAVRIPMRVVAALFGVVLLVVGLISSLGNYYRCGSCGTNLGRGVYRGICPRCSNHIRVCKECGKEFNYFIRLHFQMQEFQMQKKITDQSGENVRTTWYVNGKSIAVDPSELCDACLRILIQGKGNFRHIEE